MNKEFKSLIKRIKEYKSDIDEKRLGLAYEYVEQKYDGIKRLSGDTVLQHCVETAKILTTQKVDEDTIVAALLHELPVYTKITSKDVSKKFGLSVGKLISAYEKMGALKDVSKSNELETLRKMCLVMAKDLRVVLIKLADRLHNLQTLDSREPDDQKRIAKETMDIFVPIASRLGVYRIRSILEDLCFKFLNEKEYINIKEELKVLGKKKKNVIEGITQVVKDFLKSQNVDARVSGRLKNVFSIYKKLKKKGKNTIDDIHDIFAIRIILPSKFDKKGDETVSSLYELIGHIHNKWKPVPGRFKDYIGFPKPNGYKSLHTTVVGIAKHSYNEPVEIQIRSENMHEEAEYGVASHWIYKESKGKKESIKAQMEWIKNLAKFSEQIEDENSEEVIKELKIDIFQDRIFVFTPNGDVKDLPVGSNPIDFAYSVHTDLGHKCVMAKVNGSVVSMNEELKNGDVVEIISKSSSKPKLEWLSLVKTSSAKTKIKTYFNSLDQDQNLKIGKELLNKKLQQIGKPQLDPKLTILKDYLGKKMNFRDREDLVSMIGSGSMLASQIVWKVYSYEDVIGKKKDRKKERKPEQIRSSNLGRHVIAGGEKGLPVKIAKCCKPSFGQPIKGFITRGNAVSIHKKDCKILKTSNHERHIYSSWIGVPEEEMMQIELLIETAPDTKIMGNITKALARSDANVLFLHLKKQTETKINWVIEIEIDDFEDFESVLNNISSLEGVNYIRKNV